MYLQDLILTLQPHWAKLGCIVAQPYDLEVGAGTMSPSTFLRALGPEPWNVAYVQPSRRPADGRFGENPHRLFQHHQFQVLLKPAPKNVQELYLEAIGAVGTTGNSVNYHLHLEMRIGPSDAMFSSMAHYMNNATNEEMHNYCVWRVSGVFQMLDPMQLFQTSP